MIKRKRTVPQRCRDPRGLSSCCAVQPGAAGPTCDAAGSGSAGGRALALTVSVFTVAAL